MARSRRPLVGGNWKMNMDLASAVELTDDVVAACAPLMDRCDVAIFPPFVYLQAVGKTIGHHGIALGAQDLWHQPDGAFTGEISAAMLLDLNVKIVLAGHSERRHVIGENDDLVNLKLRAALDAGLDAVLCVGETIDQRQAGQTEAVNVSQLTAGLRKVDIEQMRQVTIAYEPVWAIGTGMTAEPADAQAVHALIRATLGKLYDDDPLLEEVRVIYGGSVKGANARELFSQPTIDGGLIGGASLKAPEFVQIVRAAVEWV